jgi:hypothetical protein
MTVKKEVFKVRLLVGDEQVAESNDVSLWQAVFAAISRGEEGGDAKDGRRVLSHDSRISTAISTIAEPSLAEFAEVVGIDATVIQGACNPQKEEPYLHLDMRCWDKWTKNVPQRGRSAMSAISLTATLLCLWFRSAGLGNPTMQQSMKILSDIGAEGSNPARSINNCSWLQLRGGQLWLNPAAIEQAVEVVRAFCEKRAPELTSK